MIRGLPSAFPSGNRLFWLLSLSFKNLLMASWGPFPAACQLLTDRPSRVGFVLIKGHCFIVSSLSLKCINVVNEQSPCSCLCFRKKHRVFWWCNMGKLCIFNTFGATADTAVMSGVKEVAPCLSWGQGVSCTWQGCPQGRGWASTGGNLALSFQHQGHPSYTFVKQTLKWVCYRCHFEDCSLASVVSADMAAYASYAAQIFMSLKQSAFYFFLCSRQEL